MAIQHRSILNTFLLILIFSLLIFFAITTRQLNSFGLRYVYTSRIVGNTELVRSEEQLSVVLNQQKLNNSILIVDKTSYRSRKKEHKQLASTTLLIQTTEAIQRYTAVATIPGKSDVIQRYTDVTTTQGKTDINELSTESETLPPQVTKITTIGSTKKCKPVQNVVFLKTHKTGSSTVLNILQRFSDRRNLSVALPSLPVANHRLGWPYRFQSGYLFEHEENKKYDIFANHARYHRPTIEKIMRDPAETKFVTILRDPLFQLESSAVYLHFDRHFNISKKNLVNGFLNKVEREKQELWNKTRNPRNPELYLVKNPNAFDFGFRTWAQDGSSIMKVLDTVKSDFHLVMISDYMLESLVLLKDELCWDLEDVVYFTLNKRPKKYRQTVNNINEQRRRVRNWNRIDYELFDHFNQTFWQKIKSQGEQFQKDVNRLREMNKELEEKCIDHGTHYDKTQPWFPILGYKIREKAMGTDYYELCKQMIRSEIEYNNLLREKQSVHNWSKPTRKPKK